MLSLIATRTTPRATLATRPTTTIPITKPFPHRLQTTNAKPKPSRVNKNNELDGIPIGSHLTGANKFGTKCGATDLIFWGVGLVVLYFVGGEAMDEIQEVSFPQLKGKSQDEVDRLVDLAKRA